MKKTAIILAVLIFLSALLPACSGKKREFKVPDPMPEAIQMAYQRNSDAIKETPVLREGEIPVYKEADVLFNYDYGYLPLGWDLTPVRYSSWNYGSVYMIIGWFPESKIVERDDGMLIVLFELDSGYRVFYLLTPKLEYFCMFGTPFIVKEPHSYKEFSHLKNGDDISEVEKIDGAAELFRRQEVWVKERENSPDYHLLFNSFAERFNAPLSTVHYLTDGILKIEYEMLDDDETIVISNIIYNKDRILPDSEGNPIDYTVCEDDLPY